MPLAAAIVPAVVGAGIGAAAKVYSAGQANKANQRAVDAQTAATQQAQQIQQQQFDRTVGLNQPFINGGQAAYSALLSRYGLSTGAQPQTSSTSPVEAPQGGVGAYGATTPAVQAGGAPAPSSGPEYPGAPYITPGSGGGFDAATYLQQNPDVAAEAANHPNMTPEQYAAQHYQQFGQKEGRAAPMNPATPATTAMPDYMNSPRPTTPEGPTYGPRQDVQMGDYGQSPDMAGYLSNFQASPDYQFRLSEGLNGVNAASAVRGKLRSGDAAKALAGYSSNLASGEYGNWFNRQMQQYQAARGAFENDRSFQGNLWNQKQNRVDTNYNNDRAYGTARWQDSRDYANNNFNTDRAYQTGRYDTNTGDLFRLTGVGLNAAGNVSGAGASYANNASNLAINQGNNVANGAYNQGYANTGLVNGIAGAAENLFSKWGGSTGAANGGAASGSWYAY